MLLSIIIPSYNHEQYIARTMEAALKIDFDGKDKEIIVIDDGSTDASVSVISEYIASRGLGQAIKLIHRENRGLVKTLNEGLSLAQGKYFYIVASDDIPIPDGVRSLVNHLEDNKSMQFALGNALYMQSEKQCEFELIYGDTQRCFFLLPYKERRKKIFLNYPHPLLLQATVFKTSTLRNIGGWREDIISDDFSMFLRLLPQLKDVGEDFAYQPDIMTCFYRRHDMNISKNVKRQFMTIDQALMYLCPSEWQDAAYLRNFVNLGIMAAKMGEIGLVVRFFRTTVAHIGLFRWSRAVIPAIMNSLMLRISKLHNKKKIMKHAPAAHDESFA